MTTPTPASTYNKNNPFLATITENRLLNKPGSAKETRHFVINIAGSGLDYSPGYSLGVFPSNPESLVNELLEAANLDGSSIVKTKTGEATLRSLLTHDLTLNRVGKKFVKAVAEKLPEGAARAELNAIVEDAEKLEAFIFDRDCVDVLLQYPGATFTAQELVDSLSRSVPRLYSIASSPAKHPGEVHLTVAIVRYTSHQRAKKGFCSGYLADDAPLHRAEVPVFMAPNKHFHLPPDGATDIIMVGPGTGIAPFRAFLEQREINGDRGRNWLFFGDQHRATDFLYEEEFVAWQKSGLLTRLDTAFSRDQAHKIYVQDRMREAGAEIWRWLQNGAYFYVCGDAKRMAKDVHQALIDIVREHGGLDEAAASEYVNTTLMKTERRYLRDVY